MPIEPIIKIKNLSVIYSLGQPNEVRALKNINLEIYPGEFVIFFGPSGCGKSTLLYSITGLETNVFGDVLIDNKNITKLKQKELENFHQKKIGMIFQAYYLINSLSVLKNVTLPQIAIGAYKDEREEKAKKLLKHFGIDEQIDKFPQQLSGGQQQRVAICRSLVNEPDILFADEPVGNLDSKSAAEVIRLISDLNEKGKKTIVLVTHNPAHLNIAHRVFYLRDGEIVDMKINKEVGGVKQEEKKGTANVPRDLELLARTFSNLSGMAGNLLIPFKAKEIVLESLTDMTSSDIDHLEKIIEKSLSYSIYEGANDNLLEYLDKEVHEGGVGLDKRTAEKIADKIKNIVTEIKSLVKQEADLRLGNYTFGQEINQIRDYLFNFLNLKIEEKKVIDIIDMNIKSRLENTIDKKEFQRRLDLPVKKGGAGLDKRVSRKIAQRLELLVLGKYI